VIFQKGFVGTGILRLGNPLGILPDLLPQILFENSLGNGFVSMR
jgi:hypothetical protein